MQFSKKITIAGAVVIVIGVGTGIGLVRHHQLSAADAVSSYSEENTANTESSYTQEDMNSYVSDADSLLTEDTKQRLDLYNANWKNVYDQVVAVIVNDTDMTEDTVTALKSQLGLTDRDSIVILKSSGEGNLYFGDESPLLTSKISTKLSVSADSDLQNTVITKFAEIQEYLTAFVETTTSSDDRKTLAEWEQEGAQIFENYQNAVSDYGLLAVDVSEYNQEIYPGATVWQASNGGITTFCISGSRDDAESFWQFYYDKLINGAANGKFTQKYIPSDLDQPRSVYGYMTVSDASSTTEDPIIYYRADIIGDICITASATEESQVETITQFFNAIGVPENNNIVD